PRADGGRARWRLLRRVDDVDRQSRAHRRSDLRSARRVDRTQGRPALRRRRTLPRTGAPRRGGRGPPHRRLRADRAACRSREPRARRRAAPEPQRRGAEEDSMIELYSIRDVARILAVQESRLRYWMQVGFVGPTVRKGGRFYYTFCDLVAVKAGQDL